MIAQLEPAGVIDHELHQRLKGLGGFRNILVHDYLRLDPDRVAEQLKRAPSDSSAFAAALRTWLDALPVGYRQGCWSS